jgi:hypothetical protein
MSLRTPPPQDGVSTNFTTWAGEVKQKSQTQWLNFCDPAGARTQDPNIKSVVLYQLSYRVLRASAVIEGANITSILYTTRVIFYKFVPCPKNNLFFK